MEKIQTVTHISQPRCFGKLVVLRTSTLLCRLDGLVSRQPAINRQLACEAILV
jgi:hypothetical protein